MQPEQPENQDEDPLDRTLDKPKPRPAKARVPAPAPPPTDHVMKSMNRGLNKAQKLAAKLDDEIDSVRAYLIQHEKDMAEYAQPPGRRSSAGHTGNGACRPPPAKVIVGVARLDLTPLPSGRYAVSMPGQDPWELPPLLGRLLQLLALDLGPTDDGLVAWKSRKWVRLELSKLAGRNIADHTLNQKIYLLREALEQHANLDRSFVQTWNGLRFAVQRPVSASPPTEIAC